MYVCLQTLIFLSRVSAAESVNHYVTTFEGGSEEGTGVDVDHPYHSLAKALKDISDSQAHTIYLLNGPGALHRIFSKIQTSPSYAPLRSDGHISTIESNLDNPIVAENSFVNINLQSSATTAAYDNPCANILGTVTIQPFFCSSSVISQCYPSPNDKAKVSW